MLSIVKKMRAPNIRINLCDVNGLFLVAAVLAGTIVVAGISHSNPMKFEYKLHQDIK